MARPTTPRPRTNEKEEEHTYRAIGRPIIRTDFETTTATEASLRRLPTNAAQPTTWLNAFVLFSL